LGLLRVALGHVEKVAGVPLVLVRVQHWPPSVARGWSDCREKHQYRDRRLSLSRQSHSSNPQDRSAPSARGGDVPTVGIPTSASESQSDEKAASDSSVAVSAMQPRRLGKHACSDGAPVAPAGLASKRPLEGSVSG
jgi:hypothetical protein